jgi:ATP-dependent RNA helicase DDX49/DBP8
VPKNPKDYVHRVGRTARAGRGGQALSIVSQYDVSLILSIEEFINSKLDKIDMDEDEVLEDRSSLLKIMNVVRIKMAEQGLDDKFDHFKKQK